MEPGTVVIVNRRHRPRGLFARQRYAVIANAKRANELILRGLTDGISYCANADTLTIIGGKVDVRSLTKC